MQTQIDVCLILLLIYNSYTNWQGGGAVRLTADTNRGAKCGQRRWRLTARLWLIAYGLWIQSFRITSFAAAQRMTTAEQTEAFLILP